jgi:DNA processing protein
VTQTLSDAERRDWLRLARTENVGPVTFDQLIQRFGTASRALAALPELAQRGGRRVTLASDTAVDKELADGLVRGRLPQGPGRA